MSVKSANINKSIYIKGSRIPITFFFQYIKEGLSISDFLSSYPWIKKSNLMNKLNEVESKSASLYVC